MPRCPFCYTQIQENTATCPHCGQNLDSANRLLGPVPLIQKGVTDLTGILSKNEVRQIRTLISRFQQQCPQTQLNIILREFDPKYPLSTHLFWLFNSDALGRKSQTPGENRDLLLGLNPITGQLAIIVGYGLEPFLRDEALSHILEQSKANLEKNELVSAFRSIISNLGKLLSSTSREVDQLLGLGTPEKKTTSNQPTY